MVNKILFWSAFGVAVRFWSLGMELRPFFHRSVLWTYPIYAAVGGGVGYWLQGVEARQLKILGDRRDALLEKRRRRAQREGGEVGTEAEA